MTSVYLKHAGLSSLLQVRGPLRGPAGRPFPLPGTVEEQASATQAPMVLDDRVSDLLELLLFTVSIMDLDVVMPFVAVSAQTRT